MNQLLLNKINQLKNHSVRIIILEFHCADLYSLQAFFSIPEVSLYHYTLPIMLTLVKTQSQDFKYYTFFSITVIH